MTFTRSFPQDKTISIIQLAAFMLTNFHGYLLTNEIILESRHSLHLFFHIPAHLKCPPQMSHH